MDSLEHLKSHLAGKVVLLGIGNRLRSDDAVGSLFASHLKNKIPFLVFDAETQPENYLGKIIREKPDTIILVDAVDFGGSPGEFRLVENPTLQETSLFFTHDASLSLSINYLQSHLAADIIILTIQPKSIAFAERLSPPVKKTLRRLEDFFYARK